MKASDAFREDAPLSQGALDTLAYLDAKDADTVRYREALVVAHEQLSGLMVGDGGSPKDIARTVLVIQEALGYGPPEPDPDWTDIGGGVLVHKDLLSRLTGGED